LASLIAVSVLVAGCGKGGSTASSPSASSPPAPAQSQGAAQGGGTYQWPSQMPPDVPRFTYGTINFSQNDYAVMGTLQAVFINTTQDAFSKYQSDLKKAGWDVSLPNNTNIVAYKGQREVNVMFMNTNDNGLRVALTYYPHQ
jgi:hypothetical protein